MIEVFEWKQGNAEVEIKSNYGDWKDAVERLKVDEEAPIVFMRLSNEVDGDIHQTFNDLTYDQVVYMIGVLNNVAKYLEKHSISEKNGD